MANKGRSDPNPFGGYTNYDEKGKRSGRTEPDLFGGYTTYDSKGRKIGRSEPNLFGGGYTHYDANGKKVGSSEPGFLSGYTNYDANGHKVGGSEPNFFGGYTSYDTNGHKTGSSDPSPFSAPINPTSPASNSSTGSGEGCYIATCVYGSYPLLLRNQPASGEMLRKKRMVPPLLAQTAGRDAFAPESPQKSSVRGINLQTMKGIISVRHAQ